MQTATHQHSQHQAHNEDNYEEFLAQIRDSFKTAVTANGGNFFTTDATDLFQVFLNALPAECRQHYTCHACRRFVDTYGGLVSIAEDGTVTPVMWEIKDVPALYRDSVKAVRRLVSKAKVTGVFLSSAKVWGEPVTGPWHHMAVTPPRDILFSRTTQTPHQAMAEKKEDYKTLINGLIEFPMAAVDQAINLLKTDSLYRSEKCLGVAEWLKSIHEKRAATKNETRRRNLTWLAVAQAPAGFCHIRSTMIGTLLEDIVDGLPFGDINRRFAEKMHPLQYQHPQAPPSAGNIAQAEKVIRQLQAAGSLARRYARIEELPLIWHPAEEKGETIKDGVFGHLKPKGAKGAVQNVTLPTQTITWDKFRTVLPEAEKIEFEVEAYGDYSALLTAVNLDAPPIIQWDFEDNRNPFSWYVYFHGSGASSWGLGSMDYCDVTGICLQPSMWDDLGRFDHQGQAVFFLLKGAKDSRRPGLALFPEILKSEFHGIRATIEAFSRTGHPEGQAEATACGIRLQRGARWNYVFRVTSKGMTVKYEIDRWD